MEWGEVNLAPHWQSRIRDCNACQSGQEGVICMRDTSSDGECPVFDKGVKLFPENELVINLFNEVQGSAVQVEGKDKTFIYIKPTEVEALLKIRGIPIEDWDQIMFGIFSVQDMSNYLRPKKKKKSKSVRSKRRR